MKKKTNVFAIVFYVVLIAVFIFTIAALFMNTETEEQIVYTDMLEYFEDNKVYEYVYDGNTNGLTMLIKEDKNQNGTIEDPTEQTKEEDKEVYKITYYFKDNEYLMFFGFNLGTEGDLAEIENKLGESSNLTKKEHITLEQTPWILQNLPMIILIGVVLVIMFVSMRQLGGGKMGGFGKSKAKNAQEGDIKVTFEDVAGADEEKEELKEIVEYLKNPAKFTQLGAKIPHGVLLVGPPGTGKTLLAKAVAGEAGVPFFSMSGSDFVEMYVGVGASRVRDLFDNARKSPAAIIFIDEIDAVGRQRGAGLGGGHDEREQTLNQLLVEMDGFDGHSGIIVMAATNRPDILDSALLRPGRFDRQVTIGYPDMAGREAILKVHAKGKPFEESVDLHKIAQTTVGFTGADLANLLNEAALLAARRGKSLIGMDEIEDSWVKVCVGVQKKNKMSEKEKYNTAIHEAGHAIVAHVLPLVDPVRQISIIPSGRALGYTLVPPTEDKNSETKMELEQEIAMSLGGRVAEELIFGDYTGGASGDIQNVTNKARKMVTVYGMSEVLGTVKYGQHSGSEVFLGRDFGATPDYSQETAALIDKEIKRIVDEGYNLAKEVLSANIEKLKFIADFLVKHETMDDEQFSLAMQDGVTMDDVENLVTEKKKRSLEENKKKADSENEKRRLAYEERKRLERELGLPDDEDPIEASVIGTKRERKDDTQNTVIYMPPVEEPKAEPTEEPKDDTSDGDEPKPQDEQKPQ
ncbi:MAG: ATP-dependent zinc metalloprotease FtsH [Clostridia bacterium]|nr:ATP-dependent zinc metalloprotease FtsH [Clostridia bacterium]